MGAKFRPMTDKDYFNLGKLVRVAGGNDSFDQLSSSLDSTAIFGESDGYGKSIEQVLERLHRRAPIALVKPTFNYVLARSKASFLWKLLGIPSSIGEQIVSMELVWSKSKKELVSINDLDFGEDFLIGAEVALMFIDNLDFETEVRKCLGNSVLGVMSAGVELESFGEITKGSGDVPLCADYYLTINVLGDYTKAFKRGKCEEDIPKHVTEVTFGSYESRLTYMLNMNRDKSGLYGMVNKYVAVVPPEMRPKVQHREHKLTARYVSVITTNNELRAVISGRANPLDIQSKYKLLDSAVSKLQYKNVGTSNSVEPDDLSVLERCKGKKGQIRMRNLGKRIDYSGRSVVVINPFLPLDMIKLPECMLPSILQFHVLPYLVANIQRNSVQGETYSSIYHKIKLTDLQDQDARKEIIDLIVKHKLSEKIPIPVGRQPTLHKLGIQAFYWGISKSMAIEMNPLVCTAFNMDFDGDTAHGMIPMREESIKEVIELMVTTQNIYLAKTGECTIEPRHEMLYGLYMATRAIYKKGKPLPVTFESLDDVRHSVIAHKVKCSDTVMLNNGKTYIAGEAAFISCFPKGDVVPSDAVPSRNQISVCEITSKTISKFINHVLRSDQNGRHVRKMGTGYASTETFVGCINHLVELGFKVAYLYTPSVSMFQKDNELPAYDNALSTFYSDMEEFDFLYDMGFMSSTDYNMAFTKRFSQLSGTLNSNIYSKLSNSNGYLLMAKCGARGKQANLVQMFGVKGMVKKNSKEAFDAILPDNYRSQLTPQEHLIAAHGGRQGQIDKSLKTGETGYAGRQLWQATDGIYINCDDCGTTKGLEITKHYLTMFIDPDDSNYTEALQEMFEHAIVGRYDMNKELITEAKAKMMSKDSAVQKVTVRSPMFCKNPCCATCYGTDWSKHRKATIGSYVGVISAQSIGEPIAQLTMKVFQKGGVAGAADITSAFDKVNAYIHCSDLASMSARGSYAGYDPIAWDDGKVIEKPSPNVLEKLVYIGIAKGKHIKLPVSAKLCSVATKGEGLSYKHGDYSLPEILSISGIDEAQKYLSFKLYNLFKNECNIMMIHFETLVASMVRHMIISTDRKDLLIGQYHTTKEINSGSLDNTKYVSRLLSVKEVRMVSQEGLDTILMENQGKGLSRACALGLTDTLEKPLNRIVLGMSLKHGSNLPNYVKERKDEI